MFTSPSTPTFITETSVGAAAVLRLLLADIGHLQATELKHGLAVGRVPF